ncbi:septal ring lytic transglycosylase RlpA family protein [Leptolyngbya sp. CCNP1308]|uniref:septal ring lytic transglycosylase RlpA family protein n=1 Tax=Leptolyngbya sp. CCNP1308 TaxID=3110255 RepID=UPI002B22088F|nr:septal ring lytic transglycosylase RlpA family protein [Leptolyngbya sp. CCNP1308]MEA5450485.1 septal ring lytic transglycosylase RlpA family protein [Leptolyngbya sp. CCNP1308]
MHLQTTLYKPLQLFPQLDWPQAAAVDWHLWNATAAVAVVGQGANAHRGSGITQVNPTPVACGRLASANASAPAQGFTIRVKNVAIGQVPSRPAADQVARQIRQAVPELEANPNGLTPKLSQALAAAQVNGKTVFELPGAVPDQASSASASAPSQAALQAIAWVDNLRLAFGGSPLEPSQVQMVAHGLGETHQTFNGTASWYGPYFHGRQTATGETFDQHDLTAAHKTLPFGTYLKVRNQLNGKSVVVRINDRGPYIGDRSLDLSYAAAQCLGGDHVGLIPYQATILAPGVPQAWRSDVVATLP